MPSWLLLAELSAAWLAWVFAAAAQRAVADARRGIPDDQRGGVSLFPVIPVFPLVFWGAALLVDRAAAPWGTLVVAWIHAVLGILFVGSALRDMLRLRSLRAHR